MKEFLLNLLSNSLENIGEGKLIEAMQKLHDKNRDQYLAALLGGRAFVLALTPVVEGSKSPIDDAILSSINDAINASAAANGIDLDFEAAEASRVGL